MNGSFDATGNLQVTAASLDAQLGDVVSLHAADSVLRFGPAVPATDPLLEIGLASVTVPLFDEFVVLTADNLRIMRDRRVLVDRAVACVAAGVGDAADTEGCNPYAGIGAALGLADVLPLDLTKVSVEGVAGAIDLADPVLDVSVAGYLDFGIFDSLPLFVPKPIVRIGAQQATPPTNANDVPDLISATFRVQNGSVAVQDLGPITIGFRDIQLGPLTVGKYDPANGLDGFTFTLGGYQNGQFSEQFAATGNLQWDGEAVELTSEIEIDGALTRRVDSSNPTRYTTTLDLATAFTTSLSLAGEGQNDEAWSFSFTDLEISFGLQLTLDQDLNLVDNPPRTAGGDRPPRFHFDGLQASEVTVGLTDLMTFTASQVRFDFTALTDNTPRPFLTFAPLDPAPANVADDGFISVVFGDSEDPQGNPLAGLGGTAGNFGIGFNPNPAEFPLEFYQLPGFFVSLQVPPDFSFGMPAWLPLTVSEIGLRFPDTLGDLLPSGDSDDTDELLSAGIDVLTNFSLLFSGGLDSVEGGWPLRGVVEDVEVDLDGLAACGAYAVQRGFSAGLTGIQQGILQEGLAFFNNGACTFPIKNLDAIDIGVEPFKIGPIEIGGGLGFGTVDVIDANGDPQEVLFGRVEGQFGYSDIGVGVELIVTEYGPVLARLFAGVPIPIGTLVGALVGSVVPGLGTGVGASLGTQSGFILTGFQGGLVFDGQPLPVIHEPQDLLNDPGLRFPLDISLSDIQAAAQTAVQNDTSTWANGFTFAASGTLTNLHVHGLIAGEVTLGANLGFNDDLSEEDLPSEDDADGFPPCGQTDLSVVPEIPVGFQLFGFGALQIAGYSLVDVGLMFDFRDPINPGFNLAAGLPQNNSLLDVLLPVSGNLGLQLCTDGLLEGSILAAQTFVEKVVSGADQFLNAVLDELAVRLDTDPDRLLSQLVASTAAGQAASTINGQVLRSALQQLLPHNVSLLTSGRLEQAAQTAGALLSEIMNASPAEVLAAQAFLRRAAEGSRTESNLLAQVANSLANNRDSAAAQLLLNTNRRRNEAGQQFLDEQENAQTIDRRFLLQRLPALLHGENPAYALAIALDLESRVRSLNNSAWPQISAELDNDARNPLNVLFESIMSSAQASAVAAIGNPSIALGIDPALALQAINGTFQPDPFEDSTAFNLKYNLELSCASTLRQIAFVNAVSEIFQDAAAAGSDTFFDVIDPSLTITGELQPQLFGIPLGEPTERVEVRVDKHQVHVDAKLSVLQKLASSLGLPLTDELDVFIDLPFDNLFRDLFQTGIPQVDWEEDWQVGFQGTVGIAGMELADVGGILFPAVPPNQPVPADHPLNTRVVVGGNQAVADDRIVVSADDFATLRNHGGVLLDGRLTLPQLVTDPFTVIEQLKDRTDILLYDNQGVPRCDNLWDCLLTDPVGFFQLATDAAGILGTEQQVAQIQMFVPDPAKGEASDFYARGQYGSVPGPGGNLATTGKLLGVELGGALIEWANDQFRVLYDSADPDQQPELEVIVEPSLGGIPRAGFVWEFDLNQPQATPLDALFDQLGLAGGGRPNPGAWLDSGLLDVNGDVTLAAFTPGFGNSQPYAELKQRGGIAMDANGQLEGLFGEVNGHFDFDWSPDGFSGQFAGSVTLNVPNPAALIGLGEPLIGVNLASVNGTISEQGCLLVNVTQPFEGSIPFSLAPGGCDPILTLADAEVTEGGVANLVLRVDQLDGSQQGVMQVDIEVFDGVGAEAARLSDNDYQIPTPHTLQVPLSPQLDSGTGFYFFETTIQVPTVGDAKLESDETFIVRVTKPKFPNNVNVVLADNEATVTILNNDEPEPFEAVGVSFDVRLFYDFQTESGTFTTAPDPIHSTVAASDISFSTANLIAVPGLVDDTPNGNQQGLAGRSGSLLTTQFTALPAYEFRLEPNDRGLVDFLPSKVQMWDQPSAGDAWRVEVTVADHEPVEFPFSELFTVNAEDFPTADPGLYGWRKLEAELDLSDFPIAVSTSFAGSSGLEGPIQFRIVPIASPANAMTFRRLDNVAVYGTSLATGFDHFFGNDVLIDTLRHGRVRIDVADGPGQIGVLVPVDPGNIDPNPQDIYAVYVTGTDSTTRIVVTAEQPGDPRLADPLDFGQVWVESPLAELDLSRLGLVGGNFVFESPIDSLRTDAVADGTNFDVLETSRDGMRFSSRGDVGQRQGVGLRVNGTLRQVDVGSWKGGSWDVTQIGTVRVAQGDFSPGVRVGGGFDLIDIRGGDFASPIFTTGVDRGLPGDSGTVIATSDAQGRGGSIYGTMRIGGDLDSLATEGGSIGVVLDAERIGSITTQSTPQSAGPANLTGTIRAQSVDVISATGGNITATLATRDVVHDRLTITAAVDANRNGGSIDSAHSIHIAGGLRQMVAEQINVNLQVGGRVDLILATAAERPDSAGLSGQLRADAFGSIIVESGSAEFVVTARTRESSAFESIRLPAIEDTLPDRIKTSAGASRGEITEVRRGQNPPGDFNSDTRVNALDIDLLCSALGGRDLRFDMNEDERVTPRDLETFLSTLLNTTYGDANLDGRFNSADLVLFFQAGQYEDRVRRNSTWATGDMDCDREFTSSDLVLMFQAGGYSPSARLPVHAEAIDLAIRSWADADRHQNRQGFVA